MQSSDSWFSDFENKPVKLHYVPDRRVKLRVSCEYYDGEAEFERCEGIWTLVKTDHCLDWMHMIKFEAIKNSLLLRECRWKWTPI